MTDLQVAQAILYMTQCLGFNLAGVKVFLEFLQEKKIKPKDYIKFMSRLAASASIDQNKQKENAIKAKKRGRKKKV